MPLIDIPFGEWLPSKGSFKNPGCEVADNVIPTPGMYSPFPMLIGQSQTVTGAVKGAAQMFNATGSIIVGGTDDRLFIRGSTITQTTGLSSIGAGEAWDFARFNAFVFATAANNDPQYLDNIDSDTSWSALPGSPPAAKRCAKVGDFLMLGDCDGVPHRLQWSAFNNPAGSWAASRLTQAGSVDLDPNLGGIQRIVGGRYATVFQQRGIQRISYVGPPQVWRADIVSVDRGAVAPFAVVPVGYTTYFFAQDGFYVTNGSSVENIGNSRIDRWFFENANQARLAEMQGAIDWQNESIVWAFCGEGSETFNRLLVYSWSQNRFSTATVPVGWVVGSQLDGVDLDSLDAIYTDLDSIPLSLDSAEFRPRDRRLSAFVTGASTSEYSTFTGTPMKATFETGEFQPSPHQSVYVSEVSPIMDADEWDALFTLIMRDNKGNLTFSNETPIGNNGFSPIEGEGKKATIRMVKPAGTVWDNAQGVHVRFQPAGFN